MKSYYDHQVGKYVHTMRQSSIKDLDICPERCRREMAGELPRVETDAAGVGTAAHTVFEYELTERTQSLAELIALFEHEFEKLTQLHNFQWTKYTELQAYTFGTNCVSTWYEEVLPTLETDGLKLEHEFNVPLYEDSQRAIYLSGTIDYWDEHGLKDWKTSGRKYQPWEKQRFDIQSTVYSYAASHDSGIDPFGDGIGNIWDFEFVVMLGNSVQRVPVQRWRSHWQWLQRKCVRIAELIEADLPEWPLNEQHALCSPLWCPAWSTCRGLDLGPDPWNQIKER